jgi:hypothetical protein
VKFLKYSVGCAALFMAFICPQISYSKVKSQTWAGTYVLKGGGGGMTIEKEGKKLWVEAWSTFKDGEYRRPGHETDEQVYFASIHGSTAKRLPFRGDICPQTFTLMAEGLKLVDECKLGPPIIYYFERVK